MSFDPYFDPHGYLVTQPGNDGGDSAQKMGLYRFGRYIKFRKDKEQLAREQAKFEQELDGLEDPSRPGWYRRHPAPSELYMNVGWWSNPRCFSRDQQRSIVMAMGALKRRKRLRKIFWEHVKRGGWYQNDQKLDGTPKEKFNTDFAAPDILGEYLRAFWMASGIGGRALLVLLYPLLLVTDISALIGLLLSFPKWAKNRDEADDDNLIMATLQARLALPTPISWLHCKLYSKYRPIAGFVDPEKTITLRGTTDMSGPESAIAWKHRPATGAPPFYEELYKDILKRYMK